MAKNKKYERGEYLSLPVASGVVSGSPVIVGGHIPGVAQTDRGKGGNSAANASVDTVGVFTLSVAAIDDAGNSAVAIGDPIYFIDADTPKLSKKNSGILFGFALATITSGSTASIDVMLAEPGVYGANGVPYSQMQLFISPERTATGSAENIAHGLGVVPAHVVTVPTDTSPATAGVFTVTEGTHTTTNAIVTVTANKKYKVMVFA